MNSFIFFFWYSFFLLIVSFFSLFQTMEFIFIIIITVPFTYRIHVRCAIYCIGTWASWIQAFWFFGVHDISMVSYGLWWSFFVICTIYVSLMEPKYTETKHKQINEGEKEEFNWFSFYLSSFMPSLFCFVVAFFIRLHRSRETCHMNFWLQSSQYFLLINFSAARETT